MVNFAISRPMVLNMQSEFELANKISSVHEGQVCPCASSDAVLDHLEVEINKTYHERPIILFCEGLSRQRITTLLGARGWTKYLEGPCAKNLATIRAWTFGILILSRNDAMGLDTRFQVDSQVLIALNVGSREEYQQMVGRSSRVRGLCFSAYYPVTEDSAEQAFEQLKMTNDT
jgi:hypothetical protein